MKKIILIIILLLLCGCDYKELNSLGIVTMITIDYKDNSYITNVELLNINKNSNNKSIIVKGKGKTLKEALDNAEDYSEYIFSYSHLYTIIISESLLSNKQSETNAADKNKPAECTTDDSAEQAMIKGREWGIYWSYPKD